MLHRSDIDGFRALAVTMVILFHARVAGFSFGFWGVDIFLVISGYLITGNIVRDVGGDRFSLMEFWSRRLRRLMPAATTAIVFTAVAIVVIGSPFEWAKAGSDAIFSSFYLLNMSLGLRGFSYFDAGAEFRPYLHMWSLALEEQFYVIWPLLLPALVRRGRRWAIVSIVFLSVLSFALSALFSATYPMQSFFLLPTRLWEFGVGAVLALSTIGSLPWRARCALAGFAAVSFVAAVVWLSPLTPLPGWLTLLPVLATAAALVAGAGPPTLVTRALGSAPMSWVGARSYSLYLWHWPVLVLGRPFVGDGAPGTVTLILITVALSVASYALVETRFRFAPSLVASRRRTLAMAAILCVAGLVSGLALRRAHLFQRPFTQQLLFARTDAPSLDCANTVGCVQRDTGSKTVLVLGDSHAMNWLPAIVVAAEKIDLKVVFAGRGGCPGWPVRTIRPAERDPVFAACARWQTQLEATIDSVRPDIMVVANYAGYASGGRVAAGPAGSAAAHAAVQLAAEELAAVLHARGISAIYVDDILELPIDPLRCAAKSGTFEGCTSRIAPDADALAVSRSTRAAFQHRGAVVLDAAALVCPDGECALIVDNVITYRDKDHITRTFSRTQAPAFERALREALARPVAYP